MSPEDVKIIDKETLRGAIIISAWILLMVSVVLFSGYLIEINSMENFVKKDNERRRAFAEHVAAGETGAQAARLAGYSGTYASLANQASRLMNNDEVKSMVSEAAAKASNARIFGAAERREILRQIACGEIEQEITTETKGVMGSTTTTQRRKPTAGERVAAIKQLDELDGLITQRHKVEGTIEHNHRAILASVPDDVIRQRLAELSKKIQVSPQRAPTPVAAARGTGRETDRN